MANLPDEVKALVELSPVEDLLLSLLRERMPTVRVQTLLQADQGFPMVLVRRAPHFGAWEGDHRFTDSAHILIHTFCEDPNGDEDAGLLAEAVRVILRDAWLNQTVVPGKGHIVGLEMTSAPRAVPDWATATGPVQYADLPTGLWRYETSYHLIIRKPRQT